MPNRSSQKLSSKKKLIAILAISVMVISGLYATGSFNGFLGLTLISAPTNVYVLPQGGAVGDEWDGSYWVFSAAVTANDDIAGITLPEGQTTDVTVQGVKDTLTTGANIEIKVDPGQPYLMRNLVEKTIQVTPETGRTVDNLLSSYESSDFKAASLDLRYYDWAENSFRIYSPYHVTVYKDGVKVGEGDFNTLGSSAEQIVPTTEGNVRIENLGSLTGEYTTPQFPTPICIVKGYPNMYPMSQAAPYIGYDIGATYTTLHSAAKIKAVDVSSSNAYSTYWFGRTRWENNNHPAGYEPTAYASLLVSANNYAGWVNNDDSYSAIRKAVAPVIGAADKSALPQEKRQYLSLLEYIEGKGVANLATTAFDKLTPSFIYDGQGRATAMKLTIPWGAYGTPVVNFMVPTALADTWITRPTAIVAVPDGEFMSTGTKYAATTSTTRIAVDVTSLETSVTGSTILSATCANGKVGLYPLTQTITSLAPGETRQAYIDVSNLGVEDREANIPITLTCTSTFGAVETGTDTVYITLDPTLGEDQSYVNLLVVEKGTVDPIVGMQVQILYGDQHKEGFTDDNGKISWTLATSGGGGYTGPATIKSFGDEIYKDAQRTVNIASGINDLTLAVELLDDNDDGSWWTWLSNNMIVVVVAIGLLMVGLAYRQARNKKRMLKGVSPKPKKAVRKPRM